MAFCDKLRELRQQNQLSQEQLAAKLNVSRQAISKWETGAIPDVDNIVKIAKYFDCSLDYLMDLSTELKQSDELKERHESGKKQLLFKKENIALVISLIGIFCLVGIWIVSKFFDVDFCKQDMETGIWYVGFRAFVEYYNLYLLIYASILSWALGITVRVFIHVLRHKESGFKKYLFFRIFTYVLYMLGTILWIIGFLRPYPFILSTGAVVIITLYILLIFCSLCALSFFAEKGE